MSITAAPDPGPAAEPTSQLATNRKLFAASTLMAGGTLASRLLGLVRTQLAALVLSLDKAQAEILTIAVFIPTTLYYLFAGGTLNTVLVPQIVRAVKNDGDNGTAYVNRIMTAFGLGTLALTAIAMFFGEPLARLFTDGAWDSPDLAPQFANIVFLTQLMMPQVFFWGVFFMAGQVLNALERFGPMAWAPAANNVVQVLMFAVYWVVYGTHGDHTLPFTRPQELLLGLGTTLGVVVQAALLLWYLRRAGFAYRPRFDLRGTGLGRTVTMAKWVLLTILVSQVVNIIIVKLASAAAAGGEGAGMTTYNAANLLWLMPHGLITVSLTTAMLPMISRKADAGDVEGVRREVTRALRLTATLMVPVAIALAVLARPLTTLIIGYGAAESGVAGMAWTLVGFCVGIPLFTAVYVLVRAFYAFEDTRTTFFLYGANDLANVVLAFILVGIAPGPDWIAPALSLAFALGHLPAIPLFFSALRKHVPGISLVDVVRQWIRVGLATLPAAVAAWGICTLAERASHSRLLLAVAFLLAAAAGLGLFLVGARVMRINEVNDVVAMLVGRLRDRRAGAEPSALADAAAQQAADPALVEPVAVPPAVAAAAHVDDEERHPASAGAAPGAATADGPAESPDDPRDTTHLREGQVLAQRYRLDEHLVTRSGTQTWRAFDQVLSRPVLLHALPPHDERAWGVLGAARRAAVATDSRFLRVLDAVHSESDEIGSYVVAEYIPGQSLEVLLAHGPVSALEAGWIVRELADALSGMHAQGLYHERLDPDTVVVATSGTVKIVGLLTEASLLPDDADDERTEADREAADVDALGKILYALLVGRWPGGDRYGLPAAPRDEDGWVTPRHVRTGVSPALDAICDRILSRPPQGGEAPLRTAQEVFVALSRVLGSADAAQDLERRLRQPVLPGQAPTASATSMDSALTRPSALPVASGGPHTVVVPSTTATSDTPVPPPATSAASPTTPREGRPRPRPLRILLVLLLAAALVWGLVAAFQRLAQRGSSTTTGPIPSLVTTSTKGEPTPVTVVSLKDFDPEGSRSEEPGLVARAVDGNAETAWLTETYPAPRPATLQGVPKSGVGLVLDLGSAREVRGLRLRLVGEPTGVEVRVAGEDATQVAPDAPIADFPRVAAVEAAATAADLPFSGTVKARFVIVWLTTLPPVDGGYRAGVAELTVLG